MAKHPTPKIGTAAPTRIAPLLLLCSFYWLLVGYSLHVFYWTPSPRAATSPASEFSEERARGHVHVLAEEIGLRSVSTPGLQHAHHYIWNFCQKLQQQAAGSGIAVQTQFENYTGSFDFDFVGERFINAYHNISNIILHISREGSESAPAVLLVAHHDSPVGSPGAGDDASNIGVMMELASNLVAAGADKLPASPVMFLFSGAEEPLCQSAAAFMSSSSWAQRVGVFINLESIGPGGSPIVFQHAGAWTIKAYAQGAAYPRGAIAAQDVFDAGLVLGDTDYRQLSYLHRGGLPGIDIAYLLAGAAYHTDRDTLAAIRPGVLQETGDSLTGAIRSLAAALAAASNSTEELQQLLQPTDHKRMFMSIGCALMLTYSAAAAAALHNIPLLLALSAPFVLKMIAPSAALPVFEGFRVMSASAAVGLVTLLAALLVPASLGAWRAWATGLPMVWFAHPNVALAMYTPLSIAALLLPFSSVDYSQAPGKQLLPYHMLGGALLNAVVAAGLTRFGVGLAMIFALWGGCGTIGALFMAQGFSTPALVCSLAAAAWPIYSCAETALVMSIVMMSRMSLTGHVFVGLGDTIVGFLLGLGILSITGLSLLPVFQAILGKNSRRIIAVCIAVSVAAATASSTGVLWPYSKEMPKRLMLGHVHYIEPAAADAAATVAAAGSDGGGSSGGGPIPMRVINSSWVIAGSDSTPARVVAEAMGFNLSEAQTPTGNEWGMIYPVSKLLDLELFPAQPAVGVVEHLPHVKLLKQRSVPHHHHLPAQTADHDSSESLPTAAEHHPDQQPLQQRKPPERQLLRENHANATLADQADSILRNELTEVKLEVFTAKPCWGTLKLSGVDFVSWSITPGVWKDAASFMAGQQRGSGSALVSKQGSEGIGANEDVDWGDGVVRTVVVKWTSEQQQGALHWPIRVRFYSKAGSRAPPSQHTASSNDHSGTTALESAGNKDMPHDRKTGLGVELHVGYVVRTPELAAMQARMPVWSTLSYEATSYVSKWEF